MKTDAMQLSLWKRFRLWLIDLTFGDASNKLFAFMLALVVWLNLYWAHKSDDDLSFRIVLRAPENHVLLSALTLDDEKSINGRDLTTRREGASAFQDVTLRLEGQRGLLEELASLPRRDATIELTPGQERYDLDVDDLFGLPGGVKIVDSTPNALECIVEPLGVGPIDVTVSTIGEPPATKRIRARYADPGQLRVRGPESAFRAGVDALGLVAEPVTISNIEESRIFDDVLVRLVDVPAKYRRDQFEIIDTPFVSVQVELENTVQKQEYERVPVIYKVRPGFVVDGVDFATVRLVGPPSALDALFDPDGNAKFRIEVPVELSGLGTPKDFRPPYTFAPPLPVGVRFDNLPGSGRYTLRKAEPLPIKPNPSDTRSEG